MGSNSMPAPRDPDPGRDVKTESHDPSPHVLLKPGCGNPTAESRPRHPHDEQPPRTPHIDAESPPLIRQLPKIPGQAEPDCRTPPNQRSITQNWSSVNFLTVGVLPSPLSTVAPGLRS